MRKGLVILLISIHLAGNTELGQIVKLPQLIQHFFQHKLIDPDLSFISFLIQHYASDDGTSADDDYDKQLPCHNSNIHSIVSVYSPMVNEFPPVRIIPVTKTMYISRLVEKTTSEYVQLILQPPRLA